jgi:FlgD Ig-like domain/Cohesin domain
LSGTNFIAGASTVSFGADITVNFITVNSDTQITVNINIPFGVKNGNRNVSVTNAAPGGGIASFTNGFNVINPQPTLAGVTPTIGSLNQRLEVDLVGANFIAGVSSVGFGEGIVVTNMTVVSSTRITCNITIEDSAPLGGHDVTVTNADPVFGDPAVLPNAFIVSDGAIVHFSVPADLYGAGGDNVEVPLNIDPFTREVGSFDAKLSFNPEVLTFIDYERGTLLSAPDWQIDVNSGSDAINLGAFAANRAITQAGTAIVLHFRVSDEATPGTTVPLRLSNLAATDVTANALPTGGANGLFTVPAEARVSGKLFYLVKKKPLAGDTVRVEFDDPEMRLQVADDKGQFEFADLPLGRNVLLTPRRISGNFPGGTITAGDALKAFKGRIGGPEPLNGYESLAADVTGDCQLTSGDALAILRRATGKWENFRNFGRDDWRFVDASFNVTTENWCAAPANRAYHPLIEDQADQNFTGIILGDVNGSFGSALGKIAAADERKSPVVAIAEPSFEVGSERVTFAVDVSQAEATYNSFDLTLSFETTMHVTKVSLGTMLKAEDWEIDWNVEPRGVLRIAGFSKSTDCIKGKGVLVNIQATLARPAKEGEALTFGMPFSLFGVNGEETPAQTGSGKLTFSAKLPQQYALGQNFPNPFVRETRASQTIIKYALPAAGEVSLRIYDMLGQTVRTLASGSQTAGIHTVVWNGRKDDGAPAATGVYLYRLEAGNFVKTNKLILQK